MEICERDRVNKLLVKIKNGDMNAVEKLFSALNAKMTYFANQYLVDKSLKQDVVNDAVVCVMRYIQSFDERLGGYNWVIKIVKNCALKYNQRWDKSAEDELSILDLQEITYEDLVDDKIVLDNAIIRLDEDERKYFYNYFILDLTVRQIAKNEQESKSTTARKIKKLKQKIIYNLEKEVVPEILQNINIGECIKEEK